MEIKNRNKVLYGVITCLFLTTFAFAFVALSAPTLDYSSSTGVNYKGIVCTSTTGDFEGRTTPAGQGINEEIGCGHNVLYVDGAELIEQYLGAGAGAGDAADWIGLCNATAGCDEPAVAGTGDYTAIDAGCLDAATNPVVGTYASLGDGNWSIYKTFKSECDNIETNVTRLFTDDDDKFAGNSFTLVTLQTNDQLTINWTITAQDAG